MIGNFNAGMNTFFDWNITLNSEGGPNHASNLCEAPIMCDTQAGTFEKRLSYYYIWHFSHFIATGAKHVASTVFSPEVDAAAFANPGGAVVVVVLNNVPERRSVFLRTNGSLILFELEPDSITTIQISE